MSSCNLPPVRHLPQWRRVGPLGKARTPRCLPATQQPGVPPADGGAGTTRRSAGEHRLASMQRNVQFLQQQHQETLEKLHAEIEYLRRENKGENVGQVNVSPQLRDVMVVWLLFLETRLQ